METANPHPDEHVTCQDRVKVSHRPRAPRLRRAGAACLALIVPLVGCGPVMLEREGHRVFNPRWLFVLESERRDEWQKPDEVIAALELSPSATVADIGAGGGYFTVRLARQLSEGHVYATDVQDEMIEALQRRVATEKLRNVDVVHAAFDDPTLPKACCHLAFFSGVYKEIDERVAYMRRVRPILRSGGRVAILGFRPEARGLGPPSEMRLAPERVVEEMAAAGFTLMARHEFVARQYLLVFAVRTGAPGPPRPGAGASGRYRSRIAAPDA